MPRDSHLYILSRSVCEWNQNWTKRSNTIFESLSRDQSNLGTVKINKSRMFSCKLTFDLLKIKWSRASEGTDQAIENTFCRSKFWTWLRKLQQATCDYTLLAKAEYEVVAETWLQHIHTSTGTSRKCPLQSYTSREYHLFRAEKYCEVLGMHSSESALIRTSMLVQSPIVRYLPFAHPTLCTDAGYCYNKNVHPIWQWIVSFIIDHHDLWLHWHVHSIVDPAAVHDPPERKTPPHLTSVDNSLASTSIYMPLTAIPLTFCSRCRREEHWKCCYRKYWDCPRDRFQTPSACQETEPGSHPWPWLSCEAV